MLASSGDHVEAERLLNAVLHNQLLEDVHVSVNDENEAAAAAAVADQELVQLKYVLYKNLAKIEANNKSAYSDALVYLIKVLRYVHSIIVVVK